jgi:hypothetical protein
MSSRSLAFCLWTYCSQCSTISVFTVRPLTSLCSRQECRMVISACMKPQMSSMGWKKAFLAATSIYKKLLSSFDPISRTQTSLALVPLPELSLIWRTSNSIFWDSKHPESFRYSSTRMSTGSHNNWPNTEQERSDDRLLLHS